ncbi:tyrosine-type recombinase/integrase [Marinifilum fragile]|uniref:tyrosine-type recombinase/integrase n=1 Tax=Marinifilum fragile TaxID=570161 RepID=UPI002AAB4095|nr:tyrosine-type recombinase/integrase [Marinifilum fragile]
MPKINFYLKSEQTNKKGQCPVFAQIVLKGKKIRKQIGIVKKSDWNKSKQLLTLPKDNHPDYKQYATFNKGIGQLKTAMIELENKVRDERRKITENDLRLLINLETPKERIERDFFEAFDEFLTVQKATMAANTVKGYKTVRNFLEKQFQTGTGFQLRFYELDTLFADHLMEYCFQTKGIDNDYFVKIVNVLNKFLKWAEDRNYHKGEIPKVLKGIREKEIDVIFLSLEELMILNNYPFNSDRLAHARDMFCFAAFTGFRHCDAHSLLPEHIQNEIIHKNQNKTQRETKIPLNKHAKAILEKYKDKPYALKQISNQKANDYIKECLKEIVSDEHFKEVQAFKRKVIIRKVSGRKVTERAIELYNAITFHMARKTFITNSLMLGANLQVLQEMGAPKRPKHLAKYVKITDAFKNKVMEDTWDKV